MLQPHDMLGNFDGVLTYVLVDVLVDGPQLGHFALKQGRERSDAWESDDDPGVTMISPSSMGYRVSILI